MYYLPPSLPPLEAVPPTADASGYSSEPESDARKVRGVGEIILPNQPSKADVELSTNAAYPRNLDEKTDLGSSQRRGKRITSSWPDLLQ